MEINHVSPPLAAAPPSSFGSTPNLHASPAVVGKQFESMVASMLIKQMRQSMDGESLFGKDPGDIVGGMFDHFLGDHIGRSGGLGIAQMIRTHLERRTQRTGATHP